VQSLLGRSTPTERKEKRGICSPDFSFAELNKSTPAIPKSKQIRVYSSMKNKMQGTQ